MRYQGLILAGGRGSRMGDLCNLTPKPLLKVRGRPMLDWILRRYVEAKFDLVHIAIRYLGVKIQERYSKSYEGMKLNYIMERDALGTAGCMTLLPTPAPLVVSNGDLCTDLPWSDLIAHHEAQAVDATICAAPRRIEFGVIGSGQDIIEERPSVNINAGMYLLESHVVRAVMMSSAHRQDMPDVINRIRLFGGKVSVYHLQPGAWHDVGTPEDLAKVNAA
jgi:NDP-sugar pyrophosphorylase family protein